MRIRNQARHSEETIKMILKVAGKLFSVKGYDSVTMREIAKEAGCSHTTIYLYFKDKETLLQQLSMPFLQELHQQLTQIAHMNELTSLDKLKRLSYEYIHFCLKNRNMYAVLINAKSSRVDEEEPELEMNQLRIEMFGILMQVIQECLPTSKKEQLLAFTRIFYYNINGIFCTYSYLHEPIEDLFARLTPTFDLAVETLILGFQEKLKRGDEKDENQ